ncbi:hypothetical protein [Streptomyces sp. NPDC051286]|uniref:hypothetical protein n=1 Tax=Streptomyces sp. NPDC051286 TaxID=3365647 RepID=UPI00379F2F3C
MLKCDLTREILVAFARYDAVHRPLVDRKQQIGPNVRLMVPRTEGGRCVRDVLVRLPLRKAAGAVERHLQARAAEPLPDYHRAA